MLANDREYSVDEEAVEEIWHCFAKEVFRCGVVRIADDPCEKVHITGSDSHANDRSGQPFPKRGIDPLKG